MALPPILLAALGFGGGGLFDYMQGNRDREAEKRNQATLARLLDLTDFTQDMARSNGMNLNVTGLQNIKGMRRNTGTQRDPSTGLLAGKGYNPDGSRNNLYQRQQPMGTPQSAMMTPQQRQGAGLAEYMKLDPAGGLDMLKERLFAKPKPFTPQSPAAQAAVDMGMQPGTPEFNEWVRVNSAPDILNPDVLAARERIASAGRTNLTVNSGEQGYDKARGQDFAERMGGYENRQSTAFNTLNQLDILERTLSNPNLYTGTGGEAVAGLKRLGKTVFGLEVEGVGAAELAKNIGSEMALGMKENLPGPMSDSDRAFLQSLPPNLANSAEGNALIIGARRKLAQREIEIAELASQYERQNGRLDAGWNRELSEYIAANPLFTDDDFARLEELSASASQAAPGAGLSPAIERADEIIMNNMNSGGR
jgi:hypothetical protein